jgi:hypothetical protein
MDVKNAVKATTSCIVGEVNGHVHVWQRRKRCCSHASQAYSLAQLTPISGCNSVKGLAGRAVEHCVLALWHKERLPLR